MGSSKTAQRRRRREAQRKKLKRLSKSGRVPQHTRAERRKAEAERLRLREAERRRQAARRPVAVSVATGVGGASFLFTPPPPAETSTGHHLYGDYVSADQPYYQSVPPTGSDHPDPPHTDGPDTTFCVQWDGGGTARTNVVVGPVEPTFWDGWEWCGPWGPKKIFGD